MILHLKIHFEGKMNDWVQNECQYNIFIKLVGSNDN